MGKSDSTVDLELQEQKATRRQLIYNELTNEHNRHLATVAWAWVVVRLSSRYRMPPGITREKLVEDLYYLCLYFDELREIDSM